MSRKTVRRVQRIMQMFSLMGLVMASVALVLGSGHLLTATTAAGISVGGAAAGFVGALFGGMM